MRWFAVVGVVAMLVVVGAVHASEGVLSPLGDEHMPVVTQLEITTDSPLAPHGEPALLDAISRFFADQAEVLSAQAEATPSPTPTDSPVLHKARKSKMTVVLLGDSMMDTLGPDGAGLPKRLHTVYPGTEFTVINHGVGAENIDSGLHRIENGYTYLGSARNSIVAEKPDVVVVESFGYNPYPLPDRHDAITKHWLKLSEIVDTLHRDLPDAKIVIAATIAPNWDTFGDGAPFINMSPDGKKQKAEEIRQYIESTISFAEGEHLPLADAYHPSLGSDKNGKLAYINGGDHIHYSDAGRALMSTAIANAIVSAKLLE